MFEHVYFIFIYLTTWVNNQDFISRNKQSNFYRCTTIINFLRLFLSQQVYMEHFEYRDFTIEH